MRVLVLAVTVSLLLAGACAAPTAAPLSPLPAAPTVAATSPPPTAQVATAAASFPTAPLAVTCTSPTATTRQVVERYFELSTSANPPAVADCFAQAWGRRNASTFTDSTALWSRSGPATKLVVTLIDVVNSCDRFRVTADMPNNRAWSGQQFISVGAEAGRPRIYETSSALLSASSTTLRCGE